MCFNCLYKFVSNISHSKKNRASYDKKCTLVLTQGTRYACQILMKLVSSRQIFEKHSNLMKIRQVGPELFHADGRLDRHEEANSRSFAILRTRLKMILQCNELHLTL